MTDPAPRTRLRKEDRREQLLDAAETLLVERGAAAVTMERLAEYAGVSKALPYSHFDNRDEVLVAVHHRVTTDLGQRVLDALEASTEHDDRAALVVRVYFDAVKELGPVLAVVSAPGSRVTELADGGGTEGIRFAVHLMDRYFGVDRDRARAAAPIVLSSLSGAVTAWGAGRVARREVEPLCVDVVRALVGSSPTGTG